MYKKLAFKTVWKTIVGLTTQTKQQKLQNYKTIL